MANGCWQSSPPTRRAVATRTATTSPLAASPIATHRIRRKGGDHDRAVNREGGGRPAGNGRAVHPPARLRAPYPVHQARPARADRRPRPGRLRPRRSDRGREDSATDAPRSLVMAHIEKRTRKGRVTYRARYRDLAGREKARVVNRRVDAQRFLTEVENSKLRGTWTDPALAGCSSTSGWRSGGRPPPTFAPPPEHGTRCCFAATPSHASATSRLPPSGNAKSGPGWPTSRLPSWRHPPSARPTISWTRCWRPWL